MTSAFRNESFKRERNIIIIANTYNHSLYVPGTVLSTLY